MFGPHPDDMTPLATRSDAVAEWARNVGWYPRNIGSAWLLHDWDVWARNPHYTGPAVPHPEDDEEMSPEAVAWQEHAERLLCDERPAEYWERFAYIRVR
jgi:hypothetical protein